MSESKSSKDQTTLIKGKEAEALREAIREVGDAQTTLQIAVLNDKLTRVSSLLAVVQV